MKIVIDDQGGATGGDAGADEIQQLVRRHDVHFAAQEADAARRRGRIGHVSDVLMGPMSHIGVSRPSARTVNGV
ncbi:hypothetical protein [Brevundimonas denitrificans]|uniref:hypothetical protein n=1 Tax=Brevundimonas denitrificans TaxID=1443434 RepID=UPI00223AC374|nr:hypothetical protein [Brevundimonas denitrificans]